MTSQASIRPYLNQAYLLGLLMVAVGLTLSPFLMGMSQFCLVLVWLVDAFTPPFKGAGGIKHKLSQFIHNKAAVLLVAFYLMHVVGLLWTSDFQYALKDFRVKLPILVMPFVLSSMEPLDRKRFDLVMPLSDVAERVRVSKIHLQRSIEWKGEHIALLEIRKHWSAYFKGLPNFKPFKLRLMETLSVSEVFAILDDICVYYGL